MDFQKHIEVRQNLFFIRSIHVRLDVFSSLVPATFPAQTDIAAEKAPVSQ
jgi:hypothetical protein